MAVDRIITVDDFVEFLKAKDANRPCEACGTNNWIYGADSMTGSSFLLPLKIKGDASFPQRGLSVLISICSNCANTRLFWRDQVDTWLKNRDLGVSDE